MNEIADTLIIDEFFENFIDINFTMPEQNYFKMILDYKKENLFNVLNSKINYLRNKIEGKKID